MLLTVSKKMQFAASFQFHKRTSGSSVIHAANFNAYFIFTGPVDDKTGMMINVTTIKDRIGDLLTRRYDHRCLTIDTSPFDNIEPTVENIARQLLADAAPMFDDHTATLVACHLSENDNNEATAYIDGRLERDRWIAFSAARRTYSPHLTDEENEATFGIASAQSGHGHYYRLRVTTDCNNTDNENIASGDAIELAINELHTLLDHKNLNSDIIELQGSPMTTEFMSGWIYVHLSKSTSINRISLWENPFFAVECFGANRFSMSVRTSFQAAHRLNSPKLTEEENIAVFGKCNNLAGHGHRYRVETTIEGELDPKTGTLFSLEALKSAATEAVEPWDLCFLDRDTNDFIENTSTSENIIRLLMPRIETKLGRPINRLRLWETDNNRFTLRRI